MFHTHKIKVNSLIEYVLKIYLNRCAHGLVIQFGHGIDRKVHTDKTLSNIVQIQSLYMFFKTYTHRSFVIEQKKVEIY